MRSGHSLGSELHNISCSAGVQAGNNDSHAELEHPPRGKAEEHDEELVEVNLATQGEEPHLIFISAKSPAELREALLILTQEFKHAFRWTYAQMPRLNSHLITLDSTSKKEPG